MKFTFLKLIAVITILVSSFAASAELVNINGASVGALSHYLKGVGAVKAKSIVSYREENGDFTSIDDIVNVKGIGEGLLKKNRATLSLTEGAVKWIKPQPKLVVISSKKDSKKKAVELKNKKLVSNITSKDSKQKAKKKVRVEAVVSKDSLTK